MHPTPFKQRYPTLEQTAVLKSQARSILVNALAGTGKTTTLAIKAADLFRTQGARRILMLASSDAGRSALQLRLQQFAPDAPATVQICTVEQLCATLLQTQGDPLERLTEPLQKNLLIRQAHTALHYDQQHHTDFDAATSDFLARDLDVQEFLQFEALAKQRLLPQAMEDAGLGPRAYCAEQGLDYGLYQLFAKYERLRVGLEREPLFYAPGDCTYEIALQLAALDRDAVYAPLQGRFDAVLFDELQDLNAAAMQVLQALVRGGNGPFVGAGDFNQHILPGAFSVFGGQQERIRQALPADTEVVSIHTTYRFGPAICTGLNPLFGVQFTAHYPNKAAQFTPLRYDSDMDCAKQLLTIHHQVQQRPMPAGQPAPALHVVLRSPEDSVLLEWLLAHEGVHYACKGMQRFYQRRELALVLVLMSVMQGCGAGVRLSQGMVSSAMEGLLRYVRRGSQPNLDGLANGQFDLQALGDAPVELDTKAIAADLVDQPQRLRHFLVRASFNPQAPVAAPLCAQLLDLPPEACADAGALCTHPLLLQFFAQAPISPEELRDTEDSLRALAQIGAGLPVTEFLGRLALMVQASIRQYQRQEMPSLELLTVERCKGHEYDHVAVPWVERGRFPRSAALQEAYRERNMLYVAMTRARKQLWMLESTHRPVSPGPV